MTLTRQNRHKAGRYPTVNRRQALLDRIVEEGWLRETCGCAPFPQRPAPEIVERAGHAFIRIRSRTVTAEDPALDVG